MLIKVLKTLDANELEDYIWELIGETAEIWTVGFNDLKSVECTHTSKEIVPRLYLLREKLKYMDEILIDAISIIEQVTGQEKKEENGEKE